MSMHGVSTCITTFCSMNLVHFTCTRFEIDSVRVGAKFHFSVSMGRGRSLSIAERHQALALLQDGKSQRYVARRHGVSQKAISNLWTRFQQTNSVQDRRRSGRPRVTSQQDDRYIRLIVLRSRHITATSVNDTFRHATGRHVSVSTIRRRLRRGGLRARRPAVRPPLTPRHRRARLDWVNGHLRWGAGRWSRVLFTDESRFKLHFNDGRIPVYRRQGERYVDANVVEHDHFGGGSVMVWGGISMTGRTDLVVVDGNLTGQRYRDEILAPVVLPFLRAMPGQAVLQDDNARPHRARIVTAWLQQNRVNRMEWPALSPDLNPIEHVWDMLGRRVYARVPPPANLDQLRNALLQEWQNIPQRQLGYLVRGMRRRCDACARARGGHTHY